MFPSNANLSVYTPWAWKVKHTSKNLQVDVVDLASTTIMLAIYCGNSEHLLSNTATLLYGNCDYIWFHQCGRIRVFILCGLPKEQVHIVVE